MPLVEFTANLARQTKAPSCRVEGATVREVLQAVFAATPALRGYVLDDQGALRRHMMIFVDGQQVVDRTGLSDPVGAVAEIYVMQALSGGAGGRP